MRHDDHHTPTRSRLVSRRLTAVILAAAIACAGVVTAIAATGGSGSSGISMALRASGPPVIVNSKGTGAIVTASGLKPGDSAVGTVDITNQSDAGTYTLSKSNLTDVSSPNGGPISTLLDLKVEDITGAASTLYNGKLSAFNNSSAPLALGTFGSNATRTYRFTITLPHSAGNSSQAAVASVDFNWTGTVPDTTSTGTTGTTTQQQAPPANQTNNPPSNNQVFTPSGGGGSAPNLGLGGSTTQTTTDSLSFFATCSQNCTVTTDGNVSVPGASKVYKLTRLSKVLRAGVKTKITIRFPAKLKTAVRKAISRRKVVTASLKITTKNSAGISRTSNRTIRIKHR
jgi:hypothetical protein